MSRIIHVDNSTFFRKVTQAFLESQGYAYIGYARGEDAIDAAISGSGDCVICGLELADMNGEDFIRQLAVSASLLPVIVVSGYDDEQKSKRLQDLGVRAIIQKSGDWKTALKEHLAQINEE